GGGEPGRRPRARAPSRRGKTQRRPGPPLRSVASHHREPRLGPARRKSRRELRIHFEPARRDRFDLPSLRKGIVNFPPRYPPRSLGPRLFIAEAHHKHPPARLEHVRQSLHVTTPV